ncbi:MAG: hypothetical protein KatS3mg020_0784 [Fimbriimonadales bacterium]|nr:MAG: hypothetical protein KatS3mg020_0784 [Fimbriimonadales bacterium]
MTGASGILTLRDPANNNSPGTLTNQGLLQVVANGGYGRSLSGLLVNSGTLVHYNNGVWFNGATLQNTGTLELQAGALYNNTGTNLIQNTATLRKTTTNSFTISVPLQTENATMEVQAGSLSLTGAGDYRTNTTWSVASGAALYLSSSTTYTFTGTHSGAIAGTLTQTAGTVAAGSGGAVFNFTGNGFAWYAGALNGGSDGLTNQGLLQVVANGGYGRSLSGLLVNSGTLVHYNNGVWFNGATLQNTGTLELQAGALYNNTGTNLIQNTATLRKTTTNSFTISVPLQTENATMEVQAGSLSLTGAGDYRTNTTWSVASGATLLLSGSTTYTFTGTHSGAIAGTLMQTAGTVAAGSGGAVFNFTGNGFAWYAGALNGGSDGLTNQGLLRVVANGGYGRYLSGLLVNSGTLVHYNNGVWFDGATLQNTGTLELQAGALYNNTGTNLIQNTGAIRKVSPDPNNPTSFTISVPTTNSGRIEVLSGTLSITNLTQTDGETRIHRGTTLTSSNPVQLQGGKLTGAGTLNAALNNTAGTIAPGINDPDHPDLNPLGILTILGNLTLGADAVLEVELTGTNNSDPANPQYDQLIVGQGGYTRTLQLGGILRVKGRDGYVPNPGDTFDIILRAGSWNRSGSFARVEVDPDTLPCIVFAVQYLTDRVRLVASIPSVDTNRDGCVDDADLLAVLFAFGQTGNGLPEDVVCDGVVDDADLLAVLFAFGQGC